MIAAFFERLYRTAPSQNYVFAPDALFEEIIPDTAKEFSLGFSQSPPWTWALKTSEYSNSYLRNEAYGEHIAFLLCQTFRLGLSVELVQMTEKLITESKSNSAQV